MKWIKHRSDCPISFALDIFGDKWTLIVVRDLIFRGGVYYGDFLKSEEKIATNILADRLELLECASIIKKARDTRNKIRFRYSLTKKGTDLLPMLIEMSLWSAKYDPKTGAPKDMVAWAKNDRDGLIKHIKEGLKNRTFSMR